MTLQMSPPHPATLPEPVLLKQCRTKFGRSSGPGGQNRNKVETAVQMFHEPTGIEAHATERRSQVENRRVALRRLRLKLAMHVRTPVNAERHRPSALWESRRQGQQMSVNPQHADYPALLAEALDVIVARGYDMGGAAGVLGVTMSQLARLIRHERHAFAAVNEGRVARGLPALRSAFFLYHPFMPGPDRLRRLIEEELPDLVAIRHDLHAHPELGYEEHRTAGVVVRELKAAGIEHVPGLAGGTGVLAHIPGRAARAVGLRADMDALPILEETGAAYASTCAGKMHACGHDGHTTMLIGAARVLAHLAAEHALPRPVTLVFQPAEEGGAGGRRMVEEGCLIGAHLGPAVEMIFGLHGWPRLPLNVLGTRPGPLLAAADSLEITVRGVGSHAAFPHVGRDPIVAAAAIVTSLQTICARDVDPLDSIVVSITVLKAGTALNVIPAHALLQGTVRTLTPATHALAQRRIHEIATNVAAAYGCTAEVNYQIGYPVTRNDPAAVDIFNQVARSAFGSQRVVPIERPVMGGEDFAFYGQHVPACFFVLGLDPTGTGEVPQLHQATFDFNDDAIATGVEAFCRLALRP